MTVNRMLVVPPKADLLIVAKKKDLNLNHISASFAP
jgi:hypothetical protein